MPDRLPENRPSTVRLRRRTPGTFVLVPDAKQGRSIRCQGQLEAATAQILTACPLVHDILEQPLSIHYAGCEATGTVTLLTEPPTTAQRKVQRCSYIVPDFLVTMRDGALRLIEVKPSAKLNCPKVQRKLAVARLYAERHGWSFHVVTERQLFTGPLLANVRLLGRFRRLIVESADLEQVASIVAERPMALDELLRRVADQHSGTTWKAIVLHLIATERLAIDPRLPLSGDTILYPGGTFSWDPFDSVWGPSGSSTNAPSASSVNWRPTSSSPKT
ncbi:MAG TPA: TnsA endonuclease N-terminal domain-containing protein [Pirellulales bacterium]|jgi:hypothetical protein|nr:TnsA endonuclease N-terminal domain-containing protein [Pirellulales bacterium]